MVLFFLELYIFFSLDLIFLNLKILSNIIVHHHFNSIPLCRLKKKWSQDSQESTICISKLQLISSKMAKTSTQKRPICEFSEQFRGYNKQIDLGILCQGANLFSTLAAGCPTELEQLDGGFGSTWRVDISSHGSYPIMVQEARIYGNLTIRFFVFLVAGVQQSQHKPRNR